MATLLFFDISLEAGLSRGDFYYHFMTKDEILEAVIDARKCETEAMLEQWEAEAHACSVHWPFHRHDGDERIAETAPWLSCRYLVLGSRRVRASGFAAGEYLVCSVSRMADPEITGSKETAAPSMARRKAWLQQDPFVAHGIVSVDVVGMAPSKTDVRLGFLAAEAA